MFLDNGNFKINLKCETNELEIRVNKESDIKKFNEQISLLKKMYPNYKFYIILDNKFRIDNLQLNEITKPTCFTGNLDDLEIYYQKINMYYSFSKIFNLKFDVDWVYSERLKVSEDINEILVKI